MTQLVVSESRFKVRNERYMLFLSHKHNFDSSWFSFVLTPTMHAMRFQLSTQG